MTAGHAAIISPPSGATVRGAASSLVSSDLRCRVYAHTSEKQAMLRTALDTAAARLRRQVSCPVAGWTKTDGRGIRGAGEEGSDSTAEPRAAQTHARMHCPSPAAVDIEGTVLLKYYIVQVPGCRKRAIQRRDTDGEFGRADPMPCHAMRPSERMMRPDPAINLHPAAPAFGPQPRAAARERLLWGWLAAAPRRQMRKRRKSLHPARFVLSCRYQSLESPRCRGVSIRLLRTAAAVLHLSVVTRRRLAKTTARGGW